MELTEEETGNIATVALLTSIREVALANNEKCTAEHIIKIIKEING